MTTSTTTWHRFYEKEFWQGYSDPRAKDYFIINSSWTLFAILAVHWYLLNRTLPRWVRERKIMNLRPILVVLNGLQFGAYGCGILVIGYVINYGSEAWQCDAIPTHVFKDEVFLRVGYALFCLRLLELTTPLVMVMREKPSQKPMMQTLYSYFYLFLIYHAMNRYTKEIMYMYPLADGVKIALRSAYYGLRSPGSTLGQFSKLKKIVLYVSLAMSILCAFHSACMIRDNCAAPKALMTGFFILSFSETIFYFNRIIASHYEKLKEN